jgi:hypothetical protein
VGLVEGWGPHVAALLPPGLLPLLLLAVAAHLAAPPSPLGRCQSGGSRGGGQGHALPCAISLPHSPATHTHTHILVLVPQLTLLLS